MKNVRTFGDYLNEQESLNGDNLNEALNNLSVSAIDDMCQKIESKAMAQVEKDIQKEMDKLLKGKRVIGYVYKVSGPQHGEVKVDDVIKQVVMQNYEGETWMIDYVVLSDNFHYTLNFAGKHLKIV